MAALCLLRRCTWSTHRWNGPYQTFPCLPRFRQLFHTVSLQVLRVASLDRAIVDHSKFGRRIEPPQLSSTTSSGKPRCRTSDYRARRAIAKFAVRHLRSPAGAGEAQRPRESVISPEPDCKWRARKSENSTDVVS